MVLLLGYQPGSNYVQKHLPCTNLWIVKNLVLNKKRMQNETYYSETNFFKYFSLTITLFFLV